jgi:hypothetical protein
MHLFLRVSKVQIFSLALCSDTASVYIPPSGSETKFHSHTEQQAKLVFRPGMAQ